jgi:hypothetical protein
MAPGEQRATWAASSTAISRSAMAARTASTMELAAAKTVLGAWSSRVEPGVAADLARSAVSYLQDRLVFVDTAEASAKLGLPVHHLRISAKAPKNLSVNRVVAVSDAWDGLLEAAARSVRSGAGWFAVEGARGSLVLRIAIEGSDGPKMLGEIRRLFEADSQEALLPILEKLELPVRNYERILAPLIEGNVTLEVT